MKKIIDARPPVLLLYVIFLTCTTTRPPLDVISLPFEGYTTFASPRTYDAPGTIYRVDRKGTKYHVMQLEVPVTPGELSIPTLSTTIDTNLGAIANYLGIAHGAFNRSKR